MEGQPNGGCPKQLVAYRWPKGQSGNPAGRPKGSVSIMTHVRRLLANLGPDEKEEAENLAVSLIKLASQGNAVLMKELLARLDGPVRQEVDITSGGEALAVYIMTEEQLDAELARSEAGEAAATTPS